MKNGGFLLQIILYFYNTLLYNSFTQFLSMIAPCAPNLPPVRFFPHHRQCKRFPFHYFFSLFVLMIGASQLILQKALAYPFWNLKRNWIIGTWPCARSKNWYEWDYRQFPHSQFFRHFFLLLLPQVWIYLENALVPLCEDSQVIILGFCRFCRFCRFRRS